MVDILEETVFHKLSGNRGKKPMKFTFPPESKPLEGYTIKRAIGRGGFGEVYYALSDAGKEVALKLLMHNMDVELRGVSQCLNLKHSNLVTIFDIREDKDGDHWIVMEYVSGKSLDDILDEQNGPLPYQEMEKWFTGIIAGLAFLHDRGIVHRDLKPANVYNEDGVVKIGDVGLAKYISQSRRNAQTESVGTVYYMAPEVARGQYGHEVDIYSLGIVLYEMLTGKLPFDGESTGEILMKHLTEKPDLASVPAQFRSVIARALEKDPQKRIPSMIQFGKEFQLALDGKQPDYKAEENLFNGSPGNHTDQSIPNGEQIEGFPKIKHHAKELTKEAEKYAKHYSKEAQDYAKKMAKNAQDFANKQIETHEEWVKNRKNGHHTTAYPEQQVSEESSSSLQPMVKPILWIMFFLWMGSLVGIRAAHNMLEVSVVICFIGGMFYVGYLALCWIFGWNQKEIQQEFKNGDRSNDLREEINREFQVKLAAELDESPEKIKKYIGKRGRKRGYVYYGPNTLRNVPALQKTNSILFAMISSMIITAVMTGCLFISEFLSNQVSVALTFGVTALLTSWAIILPGKYWEGKEVDSSTKRFFQAGIGATIGSIIYFLHEFLDVGINDSVFALKLGPVFRDLGPINLYSGGEPTLIASVIFFAGLFFIQRWWLQVDSFRKKRFRIRNVLATMFFALAGGTLILEDCGIPLTCMVATSCIVQLASEWVPKSQREAIVMNYQPKQVA